MNGLCAGSLAAVVLLSSACAVGPDFKKPQAAVAEKWGAANDARVASQRTADAQWWKSFNDPALDHLIELAYRQNLPLQVAGLRIVEARARLGVVSGRIYPQTQEAFGNASVIGLSDNVSKIGNIPRSYVGYQVGFDAAWEMDFWGKYRRGIEAETSALIASIANYYAAIVSLTAEVARTYVLIRTTEVQLQQARDNVTLQEQALAIATARFRNGETSELDPTQASTLLDTTRALIPQRETDLQQARNALSTLLAQPAGTIDTVLARGSKTIPTAPVKVAVGMPADILRRRPDVRGAEMNAAVQCARIGVSKADLYPSFSLVGTVGLDASTRGTASSNLFRTGSIFYSVGPQVNWAFLNYGRIENAVRVEDARFQQLLVEYRNTVLNAAQEVEDALVGFLDAQQAATFRQSAVTSAQRAVQLAFVAYREGAVDYQRVLDAERSLLENQDTLAQASSSIATYLVALYKALGGGWEVRQGELVVTEETRHEMEQRTNWGGMLSKPRPSETQNPQPAK